MGFTHTFKILFWLQKFLEFTQLDLDEQHNFTGAHDLNEDATTPNNKGTPTSCTTAVRRSRRTVPSKRSATGKQTQQAFPKLHLLQLEDWDENNSYDEDEPTCLHYAIEWKVCVNGKVVSKDTEQDLVLLPTAYWHLSLKPKLEKLLRKKLARNRHVCCEETHVVVSVSGRSERDLTKRFLVPCNLYSLIWY